MSYLTKIKKATLVTVALVILAPALFVIVSVRTNAAPLTTTYVRLNRIKAAQATSFRLLFKAASNQTANVTIDFNGTDVGVAQWTNATPGGLVNATQSVSTTQCVAEGFTALPTSSTLTAAGSGAVVTISAVDATISGTTYCVDLTSATAVTNPIAGEYHPTVAIGSDSTTIAVRTIAEDQIVVTAVVPPSFNFQFNNTTTDAFGNLSASATTSTTGKTITLTTNAASGWVVWAKSLNGATKGSLNSATAGNYKITSSSSLGSASHTMTNNTEDYGLATTINSDAAGGGTVTLDAAYDGTSTKVGVLDSQNFRPIASANGTANGDVINVLERATIAGGTPAANDYTDTITFIGAGNF